MAAGAADRARGLQAVLFDMDGLLVDTEPQWFDVETDVMARLGGEWTHADQLAVLGGSSAATAPYMIEKSGVDADPADVARWMDEGIVASVRENVRVMSGAIDLLTGLRAAGVPCALVSASVRPLVDAVLAHIGADSFDVSISGDDVSRTKPDPEPYLKAVAALGAEAERCVVLEDSPNGIAAGLAAGCHVVAVPRAVTITPGPRLTVVASLTDLDPEILARLLTDSPRNGGR
jgi:HAD superfamily hydrolase (TIGR01509 family)